jgi:hypothetical protein
VQFLDCISKINHIFQYFGVFCFLKTQKTLHPYWISDLRHIPSNIYLIEVLASPFLSCFFTHSWHYFQCPPPEFACMCLITRTAWVLRHMRLLCEICNWCEHGNVLLGKIVLLENATDIFLSVFKITKNFWQINSTIQHLITILYGILHKAFSRLLSYIVTKFCTLLQNVLAAAAQYNLQCRPRIIKV